LFQNRYFFQKQLRLQAEHDAMHDGSGDAKSINTFYLNNVAAVPNGDSESFTAQTGPTQQWYMASDQLKSPFAN
jgi:hypothetical protein